MGLLDTPVSGMDAYNQWMQVIGNNIANVNTVGFKDSDVNFEDMLSQTMNQGSGSSATSGGTNPEQIGLGVQVGQIAQNFSEGSLVQTGNPSDLAINGSGFFVVNTEPGGTGTFYYTRAGDFKPDSNGNLVDPNGNYLMSAVLPTPPATIPVWSAVNIETTGANPQPSSYSIGEDGTVTVNGGSSYSLVLADFPNPNGLNSVGNNLYEATTGGNQGALTLALGGQGGVGTIQQGALEQSNVDLTQEMSNMIEAQTDYNANSKVINTVNGMLQFMLQQV